MYNTTLIAKYLTYLHNKNDEGQIYTVILTFLPKVCNFYLAPQYEHHVTNIALRKKIVTTIYKLSRPLQERFLLMM